MVPAKSTLSFRTPPRSIHISGQPSAAVYIAEDVESARREGVRLGVEDTTRVYEAKIAELRSEITEVQNRIFASISERFEQALTQMRTLLPQLVVEATSRVVAGVTVDGEMLRGVVDDLLLEVAPGADKLEVQLCEVDLQKIEAFQAQFRQKFPALEFCVNRDLKSGDCMVKTRFGVLDGRLDTKLRGLETLLT